MIKSWDSDDFMNLLFTTTTLFFSNAEVMDNMDPCKANNKINYVVYVLCENCQKNTASCGSNKWRLIG